MLITLSPQRRDDPLELSKAGDVLTINGEDFDFSAIPDGGSIAAGNVPCDWIVGTVERVGGILHVTIVLPLSMPPWPQECAFPAPIDASADGPIVLPKVPEKEADDVDA